MAKNFLIELGTEELPPAALRSLAEALLLTLKRVLKRLSFLTKASSGTQHLVV